MTHADVEYELTKKALNNFENIKECIQVNGNG